MTCLKENVIIGKLIPAGSGLAQYRQEDIIDDEGNLVAQQARERRNQEMESRRLELEREDAEAAEEDEDSLDLLEDDLSEFGPMELEPASRRPETEK